jgi:hypothetical protein
MGIALDELSLVASTIVGATMALCKQPMSQTFQESLAGFLSAALDQMAASVSLINGRLPLDSSEEALQSVARSASSHPCPATERPAAAVPHLLFTDGLKHCAALSVP